MNSEYTCMPKFWGKKVVVVVGRIQILFKIPDLPTWPLSTHYSSLAAVPGTFLLKVAWLVIYFSLLISFVGVVIGGCRPGTL